MIKTNKNLKTVLVASAKTEDDTLVLEGIVRKLADGSLFMSWTGGGSFEPCQKNKTFYCLK